MRNAAAVIDGKNYIINNAGNLTEAKNNDWTLVDGFYYYVKDGEFLKECVAKIGSTWYGFNDDGQMYEREEFQIWDSKEGQYYHYRAKKGGALYCSTWYEEDGNRYYYGENGAGYEGYQTIDGKLYFFERGRVYLDQIIDEERDGKRYIADETGALAEAKKNAWTKAGNYYYYLKDDSFLTNCVAKIGNVWYGFDWDGRMMDDTTFNIWDNESGEESYYHAKKGGELLTGWYQEDNERYYYGSDGKGYEGLQSVDGKQYYFQYGRVCRSQKVKADGKQTIMPSQSNLIHNAYSNVIKGTFTNPQVPTQYNGDTFISLTFEVIGSGTASVYLDTQYLTLGYVKGNKLNQASVVNNSKVCDVTGIAGFEKVSVNASTVFVGDVTLGDVNMDGDITVLDATEVQKYVVQLVAFTNDQFTAADVDHDGTITVKDATTIQKFVVNLISKF
mgnify:CR=1 FL=1